MKRNTLIWKITNKLNDEGVLDINNFINYIDQANAIHDVIENELDSYILVKGEVLSE